MRRLTLGETYGLLMAAIAIGAGGLFALFLQGSRATVLDVADRARGAAAERAAMRIEHWLDDARDALADVNEQLDAGLVDPGSPAGAEVALFAEMLGNPDLDEVTWTHATSPGWDDEGEVRLDADGRWQVSVTRGVDGALTSTHTFPEGDGWARLIRRHAPGSPFSAAPWSRDPGAAEDPTHHLTFTVPASRPLLATVSGPEGGLWTDLHYSELDSDRPAADRRVGVAVMRRAARGDVFHGVLRASLSTRRLDDLVRQGAPADHTLALVDDAGRFLTPVHPGDVLVEDGDALRFQVVDVPDALRSTLAAPMSLGDPASVGDGPASVVVASGGQRWLGTFVGLPDTQGWRLLVVAAEDVYTADLVAARSRVTVLALALLAGIGVAALALIRAVRRSLGEIAMSAGRVDRLDFAPGLADAPFHDIREVLISIERSKTALRALGKYVPMDLVRGLVSANREPTLGGEPCEVTMMFTDIAGFTSIAEHLEPNALAHLLGRYLEVMTGELNAQGATIDKFIGDAVMALWNVPTRCDDPAIRACRAALACRDALVALEASPEWAGMPSVATRFGVHHDRVLAGHFGSPDRLSYTVLGDGVNLAARLEGLNKQYGTTALVSEEVERLARDHFAFRLIDVVAVKGRARPVRVHELLGPPGAETAAARAYVEAFHRYLARDFAGAIAQLHPDDSPSRVLTARCRHLLASPPPDSWDGVFVATTK